MPTLRLGTRGSQLALYQAHTVAAQLQTHAGVECEVVVIKTSGDRLQDAVLSEIGGKRLFVKEIEDALLSGAIDLAVHSSKDMPAVLPEGLQLGAVLPREDARDAMILPGGGTVPSLDALIERLGSTPRIGTSSIRRAAQLTTLFPGATFAPVRGNLDTRLRKLDAGSDYDALVLAAAGLNRLECRGRISLLLPHDACVPAPGQGIIAVETRHGDSRVLTPVVTINDGPAAAALTAERAVVTELGGGCQMPIGAYAALNGNDLHLRAVVISTDGARAIYGEARGAASDAHALGVKTARDLLTRGADDILDDVRRTQGAVEGLQP